jgi:hypothetical protein
MVRVIKRIEAQYKAREMEFGAVHAWCHERLVLQCECGERPTLTGSVTACDGCGTDYMIMRGESVPRSS